MKILSIRAASAACLLLVTVFVGSAVSIAAETGREPSAHKFELARQYYGECTDTDSSEFDAIRPQLKAFTDLEIMARTLADPAEFARLMTVVNDPRTIHVMTSCATEPVMWDTWMTGITDISKMSRAMTQFMNPGIYMNWMMAPMNPALYQPMMQMATPQYFTRWSNAMMNPAFYQPITALADPDWYTPRIHWMLNPQSMRPVFEMMNTGPFPAPIAAAPAPAGPAPASQASPAPEQ